MVRAKRLLSALGRHAAAYSDLVSAAAAEWRADAIRRIALALVGLTLAISAIVIARKKVVDLKHIMLYY